MKIGRAVPRRWNDTQKKRLSEIGYESVTVPSGTFNNALKMCVIRTFSHTPQLMSSTNWYANGIGLVKFTDGSVTLELSSYTIN